MRYRMIGIDLDGTLLDRHGRISDANLAALRRAAAAGVLVVPCTGRSWIESREAMAQLPELEVGVFVGGAAVTRLATGESLDIAVLEPALVRDLAEHLWPLPEAVLIFRDANLTGHDYLVTGDGHLSTNTQWWFKRTGARVRFGAPLSDDDLQHALRVGLVCTAHRMRQIMNDLDKAFGERVRAHHFEAVQMPDPEESVHVLEAFAASVDKWRGLTWLADREGIDPADIAVIGDEINDVAMIEAAGCGIAMGNAIESVKACARYETLHHDEHGVAHAIDRLLSGEWE